MGLVLSGAGSGSIQSGTSGVAVQMQDSASNSNTCQAWVTYKSTSTQSIRASFNVSSVTYVATGTYTINFTNALPDTNYSTVGMGGSSSTVGYSVLSNYSSNLAPTTTAFQVREYSPGLPGNVDTDYVSIAVFR